MKLPSAALLIAILGVLGTSCAAAAPYPTPWFIEHLQLGSVELPEGVSIDLVSDHPAFPFPVGQTIVIRNTSSTPLYVIGTHGLSHAEYADIGVKFPPGTGPLNKIVKGQAYNWAAQWDDATSSYHLQWMPDVHQAQVDAVWLHSSTENRIISDVGTAVTLKPLNDYGPGRPANVKVPDPQAAVLSFIYGTRELSVPLSVSYSLNTINYPSESFSDYVPPQLLACLGIILLYAAGAGMLWFIIRSVRKPGGNGDRGR